MALKILQEKREKRKPGSVELSNALLSEIVSCHLKEIRKEPFNLAKIQKNLFPQYNYEVLRTQLEILRKYRKINFKWIFVFVLNLLSVSFL